MLDRFLCQNKTIVSSFIVAENRKIQVSSRSMFKTVQKIIGKIFLFLPLFFFLEVTVKLKL